MKEYDEQETNNNSLPRTIGMIYLRPIPDMPNGHNVMDMYTGRLIKGQS